jgi:hypothetical protein
MVRNRLIFTLMHLILARAEGVPNIPLTGTEPPKLLSNTGIYQNPVSQLRPTDDFRSYEINQPLWVDFAQKQRMVYIPGGKQIVFSRDGAFGFPVGTVVVKHFRMEISKGVFQNLETRVLVRKEGETAQNWVGYTYKWEGNDASLVDEDSSPEVILSIAETALGGAREQVFKIPNRRQCLQCHNASVGYLGSLETRQLNRIASGTNQLETWGKAGLFDREIGPIEELEKYAAVEDELEPLEKRVKSYLAVNCSHCHNPRPEAMCNFTGLDLRFTSFSLEALVNSGHVVRGSRAGSELFNRMNSAQSGYRMPFIGSKLKDEHALTVLGRWIESL